MRPDCLTASAAPGTAGVQMAMISLTSGSAFMTVLASSNAFFWRSSQGRSAAILICGYFSCRRGLDRLLPLDHVGRGERRGDDGELALAAQHARGVVHQGLADPLGGGLVDEEVAGVGLGVGVPGDAP